MLDKILYAFLDRKGIDSFLSKCKLIDNDLSEKIESSLRIEIICHDEEHQEKLYNKFIAEGLECRLLTL